MSLLGKQVSAPFTAESVFTAVDRCVYKSKSSRRYRITVMVLAGAFQRDILAFSTRCPLWVVCSLYTNDSDRPKRTSSTRAKGLKERPSSEVY